MKNKKLNILAFGAHPDDLELGCGGTLIKLINLGHQVEIVCMTSGEAGSDKLSPEKLAKLRQSEAQSGQKIMGAHGISFLNFSDIHDGRKRSDQMSLIKMIRQKKPDLIFTHHLEDQSPDHEFYSKLVIDSAASCGGPWFKEVEQPPHTVKAVYGYEVWSPIQKPTLVVSIDSEIEKKCEAISMHSSQMADVGYLEGIKGLNRYRGALAGDCLFAEAFTIYKHCPRLALF